MLILLIHLCCLVVFWFGGNTDFFPILYLAPQPHNLGIILSNIISFTAEEGRGWVWWALLKKKNIKVSVNLNIFSSLIVQFCVHIHSN